MSLENYCSCISIIFDSKMPKFDYYFRYYNLKLNLDFIIYRILQIFDMFYKKKKKGKLFRPFYCEKCKSYDFLSQKVILSLHKRSKVYDRMIKT